MIRRLLARVASRVRAEIQFARDCQAVARGYRRPPYPGEQSNREIDEQDTTGRGW